MSTRQTSSTRPKRPTLMDVAHAAGVSRATASLVARKSPLVSDHTRARVEQAMVDLDYVHNLAAARMRAPASRMVGVVLPYLANPFFAEMLAGIEAVLDAAGRVAIIANTHDSAAKQAAFMQRMREHVVDGVILCPAADTDPQLLEHARQWRLPLVQALRYVSRDSGDYAGTDYTDGMRQATEYLVALGHTRIAFVSGRQRHSAYDERLQGFRSTLQAHGLADDCILHIELTYEQGRQAAATLLQRPLPPTAAICFNDVVAIGLLRGLQELGVTPGADFSVVGFDDIAEATRVTPSLSSVANFPLAIGQSAAKLLLSRLETPDRADERIIHPTRFEARNSCITALPLHDDANCRTRDTVDDTNAKHLD